MVGSVVFGLFSLVGLIFGSVSLATVVRAGSTLPANAVFSTGLCIDSFLQLLCMLQTFAD